MHRRRPAGGARVRGAALVAAAGAGVLVAILVLGSGGSDARLRIARDFTAAWARGDYAQMYADVDKTTRRQMRVARFADAYREALATATVKGAGAERPQRPSDGTVTVPVSIAMRLFGTLRSSFVLPVTGSDSDARIAWNRSLVFPGLRRGETLSRQTDSPRRAALLARDGTPLARLAAASGIVGSLGPAPPERARVLREAGLPPDATVGINGLQRIFDLRLAGRPGGVLFAGTRVLASSVARPATALRTSISPPLQRLAVATLAGHEGGIIVMRPDNGEILALAGNPFTELQPPGSTFKLVTLSGVLLARLAKRSTTFPYATYATIDGFKLQNANGESCGGTLALAFAVSCNSVFAPLGAKLGGQRLVDAAKRFGFNAPPSIPGAAESTIPPASQIGSALDVASSAIGQGQVQATALQMALVAATIAEGGRRPVPSLALGVHHAPRTVLPLGVARTVTQLMLGVVRSGTGKAAAIPGVPVAGKTGTAELKTTAGTCTPDQTASQTCTTPEKDPKNTDAWFVAFAPAGRPRITVGVLLAHNGAGGDTAAPVARIMLKAALRHTGYAAAGPHKKPRR